MADIVVDTDILIDVGCGIKTTIDALSGWEAEMIIGISAITYI